MKSTMRPLSQKEQEFASKNHNLIYSYLNKRRLNEDEYYDVAVFGFLRAITKYHNRKDLQKYSFSTIAWRCMDTECGNYCRISKGRRNSIYTTALRLDAAVGENESCTLGDITPASGEIYTELEYRELLHETVSLLPFLQRKLLFMKLHGNTKREINKAMKLSV